MGFCDGSVVENHLSVQEVGVLSLGLEDSMEEEMAAHSVFLLGQSHGERSLVGYSPWGRQRTRHALVTKQQRKCSSPPLGGYMKTGYTLQRKPLSFQTAVHECTGHTPTPRFTQADSFTLMGAALAAIWSTTLYLLSLHVLSSK